MFWILSNIPALAASLALPYDSEGGANTGDAGWHLDSFLTILTQARSTKTDLSQTPDANVPTF